MLWTPIEQDWLAEQLVAVLPLPELERCVAVGVPGLLEAMPWSTRLRLRALVWGVAVAGRRVGVGPVLTRWARGDRWLLREAAGTLKLLAALVWEADGAGLWGLRWGGDGPVILPERRASLELASESTFAPEELH